MTSSTAERWFGYLCGLATIGPLLLLTFLVLHVAAVGLPRIDMAFLTNYGSQSAKASGIVAGLAGSLWLVGLAAAFATPIALGTAIYLEEYANPHHWMVRVLDANIAGLAGVPSLIYGLLGLELFARAMALGPSLLVGGLTLALLILPMVTTSTRQALRAVPKALRAHAFALGAKRWQVLRSLVLPLAAPQIAHGTVQALSRALGETAPLILLGASIYVDFLPCQLSAPFTALPIQIFQWVSRPEPQFKAAAAATIVVLLLLQLGLLTLTRIIQQRWPAVKVSAH